MWLKLSSYLNLSPTGVCSLADATCVVIYATPPTYIPLKETLGFEVEILLINKITNNLERQLDVETDLPCKGK